jgi:hypothetical protein
VRRRPLDACVDIGLADYLQLLAGAGVRTSYSCQSDDSTGLAMVAFPTAADLERALEIAADVAGPASDLGQRSAMRVPGWSVDLHPKLGWAGSTRALRVAAPIDGCGSGFFWRLHLPLDDAQLLADKASQQPE